MVSSLSLGRQDLRTRVPARLIEVDPRTGAMSRIDATHMLKTDEVVIGRSRQCRVRLPRDGCISRSHCLLARTDEGWVVRDLGATNGVFVNGERVDMALLHEGDRIRVGHTELRFQAV